MNQGKLLREIVLLTASAMLTTGALAANPVAVKLGDTSVDARFIQPYRTQWNLMGKAPDGGVIQMGVWVDSVKIDKIKGREVLLRRQAWIHDKGSEGYFNIVDHRTMAPLLSQHVNSGGTYRRFEFSPDSKTVRYQQFMPDPSLQGKPQQMAAPAAQGMIRLKQPYLDFNCGMFGLLIAGFPLKEGYSARFPVFRSYDPKAEPAWIDFEVKGKETISAGPYKNLDTWLVVVNSRDTGEVITLNLAKVPPYVIKLRQPWDGRDWTFELADVTTPSTPKAGAK